MIRKVVLSLLFKSIVRLSYRCRKASCTSSNLADFLPSTDFRLTKHDRDMWIYLKNDKKLYYFIYTHVDHFMIVLEILCILSNPSKIYLSCEFFLGMITRKIELLSSLMVVNK